MTRTTTSEHLPCSHATSLFIVVHLAAVSVVFAAARIHGGGFAPSPWPFDSDGRVHIAPR